MESGAAEGSTSKADAASDDVSKKSVIGDPVEVKNDAEERVESETRVVEGVTPIAPITPLPVKEVRDRDVRTPRAVVPCRLAKIEVDNNVEESDCSSPCTPKQGVFDPFAPGPDDMCLAPKLRKKTESRVGAARQLDFDCSSSGKSEGILGKISSDDEKLLELVCGDILDVIVPSRTELDEAEIVAQVAESDDGFKTPPRLVPCFNKTANKCPDAPMKQGRSVSKRLHIDSSLCRRLEF